MSSDESVQLGIAGHKQVYNAALALQLCRVWLSAHGRGEYSLLLLGRAPISENFKGVPGTPCCKF